MQTWRSLPGAVIGAVLSAVVTIALVACSSPTQPDDGSAVNDAPGAPEGQVVAQGSMVKAYLSTEELAEDATLLVLGEVIEAAPATISDAAVTRYVLKVERVLGGTVATEIVIYQFGRPGVLMSVDGPKHLEQGERYILFVRPTDLPAGQSANDGYYIVGPGAWAESGDSRFELWLETTSTFDLGSIPTGFMLRDAAAELSADRVGTTG